jgi:hypothetical protein
VCCGRCPAMGLRATIYLNGILCYNLLHIAYTYIVAAKYEIFARDVISFHASIIMQRSRNVNEEMTLSCYIHCYVTSGQHSLPSG